MVRSESETSIGPFVQPLGLNKTGNVPATYKFINLTLNIINVQWLYKTDSSVS